MTANLSASLAAVLILLATGVAHGDDWPQFLGPRRNGVSLETNPIVPWSGDGPKPVWQRDVGAGFAGPAIKGERLLLFHRIGDEERLECFMAATGKPMWTNSGPTRYEDSFRFDEGPRAVPTIDRDHVFALGAEGGLRCVELTTGKTVWMRALLKEYEAEKGFFGVASAPLVFSNVVIVNIGGSNGRGIVGLDRVSGRELWKATDDEASYAAPVLATINGKPLALCFTRAGLVGLEPASGKVLFEVPWRARSSASVNAATPLVWGNRVFITTSYDTGAKLLGIDDGKPTEIWSNDESLSSHYPTPVWADGHLFGFHGRQESGAELRCIEAETGKVLWAKDGLGIGHVIRIGNRLVVLRENGELLLMSTSSVKAEILARGQILGFGVRAAPAYSNGRLFARSPKKLMCVKLAD